jgi:hypothetical protein
MDTLSPIRVQISAFVGVIIAPVLIINLNKLRENSRQKSSETQFQKFLFYSAVSGTIVLGLLWACILFSPEIIRKYYLLTGSIIILQIALILLYWKYTGSYSNFALIVMVIFCILCVSNEWYMHTFKDDSAVISTDL